MEPKEFEDNIAGFRGRIKAVATDLLEFKKKKTSVPSNDVEDPAEVIANMTLAYRHLEDAAMRLGKVIQAYDGGTSVYDK